MDRKNTSQYSRELSSVKTSLESLLQVVRRLRDPTHGCDWDKKQSFQSIVSYTIEEAYEVVDAIENFDPVKIKDELGDLLFQIVFYSILAEENRLFNFDEIVQTISEKMIERHPQVFPKNHADYDRQSVDIEKKWEQTKNRKLRLSSKNSLMDDIPINLPAILRTQKLQKKAASVGFDWHNPKEVMAKLFEEIDELEEAIAINDHQFIEEEFGDLLFTCINLSRHLNVNAESALRKANNKFQHRFSYMEQLLIEQGKVIENVERHILEALWVEAKKQFKKTIP